MDQLMNSTLGGNIEPAGNAISRGLRALFIERRLPYRVERAVNSLMQHSDRARAPCTAETSTFVFDASKARTLIRMMRLFRTSSCDASTRPPGFDIEPSDTVIDIGGNIGTFTVLAARLAWSG